jgi:CDP-glucose 4,6-dehydratase
VKVDRNSFWQGRPVLVTGATGLLGGWLVKRLISSGADVVCAVRDWIPQCELVRSNCLEQVKVVRGDICDRSFIERVLGEHEIDTVMHLAAQTIVGIANRNPISTFESNIAGTWQILEACRHSPTVKQIIMASSDKAYGDCETLPYVESTPLQGLHPYDVSKSCADLIAQTYGHTYNLPVAITRCGNFYGGGDLNWNRIIPGTIRSILNGEAPVIRSDGSFIRDYIYVEDGAAAYTLLAEKLADNRDLAGQAFNFSNESQVSVLELVNIISKLTNSELQPIVQNRASNEIKHQFLDATKAKTMLDWSPEYTLDTGLEKTIAWYRQFLEAKQPTINYIDLEIISSSSTDLQAIHN